MEEVKVDQLKPWQITQLDLAARSAQWAEEYRGMLGRVGAPPVHPATVALARHYMRVEMEYCVAAYNRSGVDLASFPVQDLAVLAAAEMGHGDSDWEVHSTIYPGEDGVGEVWWVVKVNGKYLLRNGGLR